MSIVVIGLPTVLAGFARKEAEIAAGMEDALEAGARVVRDAWVQGIETDDLILTGDYRDSIRVQRDEGEVAVTSDVPYAPFLEFGTSRQAAHPVAQRAADEHHDAVLDAEAGKLREVIR